MSERGGVVRKPSQPIADRNTSKQRENQPPTTHNQFFSPSVSSLPQNNRILSPSSATNIPAQIEIKAPSIWVKKYVDYSSKYGLGYLLSN